MEVHNEDPVKTGVQRPVSTKESDLTPAQIAEEAQKVVDLFQAWTASSKRTSADIIRFCAGLVTFVDHFSYGQDKAAKAKFLKSLDLTPEKADQQFKRYRSIGEVAQELAKIQDSLPPWLELIYEVSKGLAPGKDADKRHILNAVKDGRLTMRTSLEEIRSIRNPLVRTQSRARGGKERRAPSSSVIAATPESMSAEQIIDRVGAQGGTSSEMEEVAVKQIREAGPAESAKTPAPVVIKATPSAKAEEPSRLFQLEDMAFTDIKVEGTTITGRFVIKNALPSDPFWMLSLPLALNQAIQGANG